jgi:hypothetical protein
MENITRISDLPENITVNIPPQMNQGNNMGNGEPNTNYTPLNIHPNPYISGPGVNPAMQNTVLPLPQQDNREPQYKLPSRDIPMNQSQYAQDEEIKPNYIPRPKTMSDYIEDYDVEYESRQRERDQDKEKKRVRLTENIWNEFQIPIFVAILFFIFHMPAVNTFMYKYLSFLQIYGSDGNINFAGLLMKSIFFGALFYWFNRAMDVLSEL